MVENINKDKKFQTYPGMISVSWMSVVFTQTLFIYLDSAHLKKTNSQGLGSELSFMTYKILHEVFFFDIFA